MSNFWRTRIDSLKAEHPGRIAVAAIAIVMAAATAAIMALNWGSIPVLIVVVAALALIGAVARVVAHDKKDEPYPTIDYFGKLLAAVAALSAFTGALLTVLL